MRAASPAMAIAPNATNPERTERPGPGRSVVLPFEPGGPCPDPSEGGGRAPSASGRARRDRSPSALQEVRDVEVLLHVEHDGLLGRLEHLVLLLQEGGGRLALGGLGAGAGRAQD